VDTSTTVFPAVSWNPAMPTEAGMDEALFEQTRDYALTRGFRFIISCGKLVYPWGYPYVKYDLKSTTKSNGHFAKWTLCRERKCPHTAGGEMAGRELPVRLGTYVPALRNDHNREEALRYDVGQLNIGRKPESPTAGRGRPSTGARGDDSDDQSRAFRHRSECE
jgi:hypothetical protein